MKKLIDSVATKELIKFNLQLHDDPPAGDPPPSDPPPTESPAKTFSQADVNALIARESKAAQTKLFKELGIKDIEGHKDGMEKFHEWQKSQKTAEEIQAEKDAANATTLAEKDAIIKSFQDKEIITGLGVNPTYSAKVLKLAELEEGDDLKTKVEKVLTDFPMFKGEVAPEVPGQFGAGTKGGGGATKPGSPDKDAIAKAMGTYKAPK